MGKVIFVADDVEAVVDVEVAADDEAAVVGWEEELDGTGLGWAEDGVGEEGAGLGWKSWRGVR